MENNLHFEAKNKKDKLFLVMTTFILTLFIGGLCLGILTGTQKAHVITPNPYFMSISGLGLVLFGVVFVTIFWGHKLWIMVGGGVMALGIMVVLSALESILPVKFMFSTGNIKLDQILYSCLGPIFLCFALATFASIKRLRK